MKPQETAEELIDLYKRFGHADYIGEPVSQLEHMCQAAELAEKAGADEEMILAAFFHDIGHLYEALSGEKTGQMEGFGTVDHEALGADFIREKGFGERCAKLVASHVAAKRYLTATDTAYYQKLSEASRETLRLQGGPMTDAEILAFEADPLWKEYIQLRQWDEQAKETGKPLPDFAKYREMMMRHLEKTTMENIELVVFDLAGTTVYDDGSIVVAFQKAMATFGYQVPETDINPLMGYYKPLAISMMLEKHEKDALKITDAMIEKIHHQFEREMIAYYQTTASLSPLPFTEQTFRSLKNKGVKIGLNTGFSRPIADAIMERLGWLKNGLADALVASNEVEKGRPHPFMIRKLMQQMGVTESNKVVKVGDTEVDVMEGKNASCLLSVAVTTGAFTEAELLPYHPDFIIHGLDELIPLLEKTN